MTKIKLLLTIISLSFVYSAHTLADSSSSETQKSSGELIKTAVFAGGCFWCTESDFEKLNGVISAESGYTGGTSTNPTYREVTRENTGHYEAVKVTYDSNKVSFAELVDYFWYTIDPTDPIGQFCDKGSSYRSAFFYETEAQQKILQTSVESLKSSKPFKGDIATKLLPLKTFYSAEDYHQDYYLKNPVKYSFYRSRCGRDKRIKKLWGEVKSKQI